MHSVLQFLKIHATLIGLFVVVGAGAAWYVLYNQNGNGNDTIVVARGALMQQVSVSGKVIAADSVTLAFTQGGRIAALYARVGTQVSAGTPLSEVENNDIRALVLQREAALLTEEANLEVLREGTREEEVAVAAAEVSSATTALERSLKAVVDAIRDAYRVADNAVRVQSDQFITSARTNPSVTLAVSNAQRKLDVENQRLTLEGVLTAWEGRLPIQGAENLDDAIREARENLSTIALFLATTATLLSESSPSGTVTKNTIDTYITHIATARTAINAAATVLTTTETAQKNAERRLESAERSLVLIQAPATPATIRAQEARVHAARAAVRDAEAQLEKTIITAPFSGVVTRVDAEVGESVGPSTPVISLISEGGFYIETFIPEVNVALVAVGNPVTVTLDAYGSGTPFLATVASIDPANTLRDGVSTYRALLSFNQQDARIRAGMTANATITTAQKDDVITIPRGVVETRDGITTVPVLEGEAVVMREVILGLTSLLGTVEVVSGLREGDRILIQR